MKKLYKIVLVSLCICFFFHSQLKSQDCSLLHASCVTFESRCAATGSIKVTASGGSGNYKYKTTGPVNTNFTSLDSITGLSAGTYTVVVNDIISNCTISVTGVVVAGSYQDPRFNLSKTDVTCDNGNNGSITATGQQYGRAPFVYKIVAPSPMGVNTTNSTGVFTGLIAGNYTIRLTDSCGGIQTRVVTVNNYTWSITSYPFTQTACDEATGNIRVVDSYGNISTVTGIPGFMYGVVRSAGDTIWSSNPNFTFQLLGHQSFQVVAKDACGTIKRGSVNVSLNPSVGAGVNTFNFQCNSFSVALFSISNFFNGDFCLYDVNDVQLSCNSTGIFNNIPYGSYCIRAHDACTDTLIQRCFTITAPPVSVNGVVSISNKSCTDFTASITGQVGLTHPQYCLVDSMDMTVSCNSTGVFNHVPYGPYCITITDGCVDTTFTRCFSPTPPTPVVHPIVPAYITCTNFGIAVSGDSLTNPLFCLYDGSGMLITCNNTGVFDSIPFGPYCVTVHDDCTDTTITVCVVVDGVVVNNDLQVQVSDERCTTFTATISTHSLDIIEYCLYTPADVLVACNATGVFDNLPYGSYCVKGRIACPDTIVIYCFTAHGAIPSVNSTVSVSNKTCTTFRASITHYVNLSNPDFCLYDNHNVLIGCNGTGVFPNLAYGSYCITVRDGCYDTTITRCFTVSPTPVNLSVNSGRSCSYGYAQVILGMGGAVLPVNIRIYSPDGNLYLNQNFSSNNVTIDSIPGTTSGAYYKIVATDNCGNRDSVNSGAPASYFNHNTTVDPKCPGGLWPNGSGNIIQHVTTNMGSVTVRIIKKDGVTYSPALSPNLVSGNNHRFYDLGPGTYVIRSKENDCNKNIYDTVTIGAYQFPNLNRSSAYQCDVNGFSVGAVAGNGVPPYLYEIIGSVPATPSIISGQQAGSIFNINNGSNYSLIRLRAVDACGNATLGDASILPLANNGIVVTSNCFLLPTTLSVDSIMGATYAWYKKDSVQAVDSIFLGTSSSVYVPMVTLADTGIYTCYLVVNSGCIKRTYHFNLDGSCYSVLNENPVTELKGKVSNNKHLLYWDTQTEEGLLRFTVEKKKDGGRFSDLGALDAAGNAGAGSQYQFTDPHPYPAINYYRLRIIKSDGSYNYSNTIALGKGNNSEISVYPNPVKDLYTIRFQTNVGRQYKIILMTSTGRVIQQTFFGSSGNGRLEMQRPAGLMSGMYFLRIINTETGEESMRKIVFL
jgi:hypothetical protein